MRFNSISINHWKQFENVDITFHPRLTVLTGVNGSGKSTILRLLARHFHWESPELSTLSKNSESGELEFHTRVYNGVVQKDPKRGSIKYDNGSTSNLIAPNGSTPSFNMQLEAVGAEDVNVVEGMYIDANRPPFSYMRVSELPSEKRSAEQAYGETFMHTMRWAKGEADSGSVSYTIKQTLITWATYGYGNKAIESDRTQINNYENFEKVLSKLLPTQLGFKNLIIKKGEVFLNTEHDEFLLEGSSGGITSIITLAWEIYLYSLSNTEGFVVLIDEIETHLHASLQRSIMPKLLEAFPDIQFIISTHSPLVIGSVKDSKVYALTFGPEGVISDSLDIEDKAQTASEILQDVLGVPFTMPIWAEKELNQITNKYAGVELSLEVARNMRNELTHIGLGELVPSTLVNIINKKNDKTI